MKLQNQVTSLELSKKLKELGVKQESLFYWQMLPNGEFFLRAGTATFNGCKIIASAFSVAEIGEMLPNCTQSWCVEKEWICIFKCVSGFMDEFYGNTEADSRTKLLIHLIEKGIVKP